MGLLTLQDPVDFGSGTIGVVEDGGGLRDAAGHLLINAEVTISKGMVEQESYERVLLVTCEVSPHLGAVIRDMLLDPPIFTCVLGCRIRHPDNVDDGDMFTVGPRDLCRVSERIAQTGPAGAPGVQLTPLRAESSPIGYQARLSMGYLMTGKVVNTTYRHRRW